MSNGTVTIFDSTIKDPITTIGKYAGICYGSGTSDPQKNYKRGLNCIKSGHGRVLEFCDVHMELAGWSARVMREFMRHTSDGLTALQASTRYIKEDNFKYFTPTTIWKDDDCIEVYKTTMDVIQQSYNYMLACGIPQEDAANILPLGMETTVVIKKNARCLQNMAAVRLCNRTYSEYRMLMREMIKALKDYSEEWATLCDLIMVCKCDITKTCQEEKSCGKYEKVFDAE